jgi:hypothetical protein
MTKHWFKVFTAIFATSLLIIGPAVKTSAHNLVKDGKISAFLHIDPNDIPQPGKLNTVHIYFNDQDFRFTTEGCDCKIIIAEGKKILYNGILPPTAPRVGQLKVLLPDNNFSYMVVVSGTPKSAGFFQPFKLNFDINVGNPPPKPPPGSNSGKFLVVILAAVLLMIAAALYYRKLKKGHSI